MINIGSAILHVLADRTQVDSTLSSLEGTSRGWASRVSGVLQGAFSFALGGFLQNALGSAVNTISGSIIGVNAMLETTNKQFATLMGDSQVAADHVKMLFDLGAQTPYTTEQLISMSKHFQTFGGAALNGKENLVLFGDAASAVQAPIERVGFWVGRLYSNIQNGKPFGDAAMNLQELGMMSGETRDKLEAMQKAGASGSEIWKAYTDDMKRFSGAMAEQATTWQGLTSTLSDNLSMLGAKAFAPLFEGAKKAVAGIITLVNSDAASALVEWISGKLGSAISFATDTMLPALQRGFEMVLPALEGLWSAFQTAYNIIEPIVSEALTWGENIGSQLAQGIMDSVVYVQDAMSYIGDTLAYWLAPGSPPRVAPDLDQWGMAAGSEFWQGIADADYSAIQNMGDILNNFLSDLVDKGSFNKKDVIPTVIGTREAFARVIKDIDETGSTSEEAFQAMVDAAGPAGAVVADIAGKYMELKAAAEEVRQAQEELNAVNEQYNAQLDPLNSKLKDIQDKKKAIDDQEKLNRLQEEALDTTKTEAEREKARLEIEEIHTKQQIEAIKKEQDAAVKAAQQKLDAARARQEEAAAALSASQQAQKATHDENQLIREQIGLLQKLEQQQGGKGGKGGGPPKPPEKPKAPEGAGPENPLGKIEDLVDGSISRIETKIRTKMREIGQSIETALAPAKYAFEQVFGGLENVADSSMGVVQQFINTYGNRIVEDVKTTWSNVYNSVAWTLQPASDLVRLVLDNIASFIDRNGASISATWGGIWVGVADIVNTTIDIVRDTILPFLGESVAWWEQYGDRVQLLWDALWNMVSSVVLAALGVVQNTLHLVLDAIHGDTDAVLSDVEAIWTGIFNAIQAVVEGVLDSIAAIFGTTMADIESTWTSNWEMLKSISSKAIQAVVDYISGKLTDAKEAFTSWWSDVKSVWDNFVNEAAGLGEDIVGGLVKGIVAAAQKAYQAVIDMVNGAIGAGKDAAESHSPSELSAREIGEPITQGVAMGILRAIDTVRNAMRKVAGSILEEMEGLSEAAAQMIRDSFDATVDAAVDQAQRDLDNLKKLQDSAMTNEELEKRKADIMKMPESEGMKKLKDEAKDLESTLKDVQDEIEKVPYASDVFSAEEAAKMEAERAAKVAELEKKAKVVEDQIKANQTAQEAEEAERQKRIKAELAKLDEERRIRGGQLDWAKQELDRARTEAAEMAKTDAAGAQEWYAMRSDYIFKVNDLWKQYAQAGTQEEKDNIMKQMGLLNSLWDTQQAKFENDAKRAVEDSPLNDMIAKLEDKVKDLKGPEAANMQALIDQLKAIKQAGPISGNIGLGVSPGSALFGGIGPNQISDPQFMPKGSVVKQFIQNIYSSARIENIIADFRRLELEERARY